jgi:hypothetical protein
MQEIKIKNFKLKKIDTHDKEEHEVKEKVNGS